MNRQLSLFDAENTATASIAGFDAVIKASMNRAAVSSQYSRQQLVDRMNSLSQAAGRRLTGGNAKSISLDTLEKWLNPESDSTPTLRAVHVFMLACGSTDPLEAWAGLHGCAIMTQKDRRLRDLGEKKLRIQRDAREVKRLEDELTYRITSRANIIYFSVLQASPLHSPKNGSLQAQKQGKNIAC